MKASDIPNLITAFRFLLVPPVVVALLNERLGTALILFFIAGLSDALDGYLAKRNNWTSRLGEMMDPLADKLLLVSAFVTLGWLDWLPMWLVALVILRDAVIVAGAITYHFQIEPLEAAPTWISKVNTTAQILLVLAVVLYQGMWVFPEIYLQVLIYTVLVTTVLSGLDYVWTWTVRAKR